MQKTATYYVHKELKSNADSQKTVSTLRYTIIVLHAQVNKKKKYVILMLTYNWAF
jgi:hypothetical protein